MPFDQQASLQHLALWLPLTLKPVESGEPNGLVEVRHGEIIRPLKSPASSSAGIPTLQVGR
jgi:hypothetical protein